MAPTSPIENENSALKAPGTETEVTGREIHFDLMAARSRRLSKPVSQDDGIYNIHSRSRSRGASRNQPHPEDDEDPELNRAGDFRGAQVFKGTNLLWLSYQSLGVIYGDIGTSPLYVYSSTFSEAPSRQDLVGVLSIIIWSLFLMVTVKYILIILWADNDGEGGTFSTYALLSRFMNITNRDPREASLVQIKRQLTDELGGTKRRFRQGLEKSKFVRGLLKVMGILAVTMVIADGVLTPAQSVLGAVQGAQVVNKNLSKGAIIGITDAILVLLFLVQPLGITKITMAFSPVILIWLGLNAAFGIYNLVKFDATVFSAFNPGYAFEYLIREGEPGWRRLGGILLTFTGVEALFADLGAFSRPAVQLSWLCYTLPCLLLAYIGQAAYISVHPDAYSNPFFNAAPPGTIYPSLIFAILAAIVASQAITTATFQLLAQVMKLSYFPQLKVIHTSKIFHGQLYIPLANWLLMIGTIMVASIYNNTTSLGNAYGLCVMFVTFFDTCLVSLAAIFVWNWSPYIVFLPWLTIACLDGAYLSSALLKVPVGAWFTLTLAGVLAAIFLTWRFGKEQQWAAEAEDRFPTSHFVKVLDDRSVMLKDTSDGILLNSMGGLGIFFDKAGETTPTVFSQFISKLAVIPEIMIFLHLRPLEVPTVGPEERYAVSRLGIPHCYRMVVRYGFNDVIVTPNLAQIVYDELQHYLLLNAEKRPISAVPSDANDDQIQAQADDKEIDPDCLQFTESSLALDRAFNYKVLYVVGKEQMKIKPKTNYFRLVLLHVFLWIRENTRNKMSNLNIPIEKLVEVGFLKEI